MGYALWVFREAAAPYGSAETDQTDGTAIDAGTDLRVRTDLGVGTDLDAGTDADIGTDVDAVDDLGDEIATLAAHIHAATRRLLALIARFDRARGWEPGGHRTCAHWLSYRTGFDLGTAREHVRVARALEDLPVTGGAMARGALSFSKVRALTRLAEPDTEQDLVALAEGCTTAQLERMVRAWKKGTRQTEAERERERHQSRKLSVFPDDDGMYVIRGRLEPEVGALLQRAIEAAGDALYRERNSIAQLAGRLEGDPDEIAGAVARSPESEREAARRRADALGLLAERALSAGFGESGERDGARPENVPDPADTPDTRPAHQDDSPAPVSGTRAERYQVVLHVDAETLTEDGELGQSELEDGARVSAETSRRLCCDASVVRATWTSGPPRNRGAGGAEPEKNLLNVGRRTRTIPPALRRALEIRDRGCRSPGCGLRFTDAHHVIHWADGGETCLSNTLLLCRYHHRLVHEGGWSVEWWGRGRAVFHDPRGNGHFDGRRRHSSEGSGFTIRRTGLLAGQRTRATKADGQAGTARS